MSDGMSSSTRKSFITHRALAVYALGADGDLIKKMYEKDCGYEKGAFNSPKDITEENFMKHLGDDRYYTAYRRFFTHYIHEKGKFSDIPSLSELSSPLSKKQKKKKKAAALQNLEQEHRMVEMEMEMEKKNRIC
ncbi:hypothetical protein BDQ17DRAFT_1428491 [Cyathus striatus]|nr:hypothetical protein BDQ17DRAFT_1428491 [Cyathus striatus]